MGNKRIRHRDESNGHAVQYTSGRKEYWYMGKKHRYGGPAIIDPNGNVLFEYWIKGKLHRIGGPAVIYANGTEEYWVNDKNHRIDGPAIIGKSNNEWYYKGKILMTSKGRTTWKQLKEFWKLAKVPQAEINDAIRRINAEGTLPEEEVKNELGELAETFKDQAHLEEVRKGKVPGITEDFEPFQETKVKDLLKKNRKAAEEYLQKFGWDSIEDYFGMGVTAKKKENFKKITG